LRLIAHTNPNGLRDGINPFDHGAHYTRIMKTEALLQALQAGSFDAAFGGARRDEEPSRAKERIFSFRTADGAWDPRRQRPEFWRVYNTRTKPGENIRVFPLSNWTEADIWDYIAEQEIPLVPLYFARALPVVERDGSLIVVHDDRMRLRPGERPAERRVRFRSLGCYPLTGALESQADSIDAIRAELAAARVSERGGRLIDRDDGSSLEQKKREGYF
jgi:sulfate adenylyltransferase subunit 2